MLQHDPAPSVPRITACVATAYREYVAGKTLEQIATQYGITRQAVGIAFKRAGLQVRPRGCAPRLGAKRSA